MIISTAIHNIPAKFWTDYFVAVNLHPHHRMNFTDWIKNISPAIKTVETAHFKKIEGSYYDAMPYIWKQLSVPVWRYVMFIIDIFVKEAFPDKSLCTG